MDYGHPHFSCAFCLLKEGFTHSFFPFFITKFLLLFHTFTIYLLLWSFESFAKGPKQKRHTHIYIYINRKASFGQDRKDGKCQLILSWWSTWMYLGQKKKNNLIYGLVKNVNWWVTIQTKVQNQARPTFGCCNWISPCLSAL